MTETILVVDDDPFMFEYIQAVVENAYELRHCVNGASCLQMISEIRPALVLLDVHMPDMNGYEVCRQLREDSNFDDLAVVFISAACAAEDRLAAYDAGANDYLTKPIAPKELLHKVAAAISSRQEMQQLRANSAEAFSVAMSAMSDASAFGRILTLFRMMFSATSQEAIGQQLLDTLLEMDAQATVQIRGKKQTFTRDTQGRSSPMEEVMLRNMSNSANRISEFGQRMAFVYGPVSLLIKNAPADEGARGRLRDYGAFMAEGASERVTAMERASLEDLLRHAEETLGTIASEYQLQQTTMVNAFNVMLEDFQNALLHTGLTAKQEDEMISIVQTAMLHARDTQARGLAIDQHLKSLKQRFDEHR